MKLFLLSLCLLVNLAFSSNAMATVDAIDKVYLVTIDVHGTEKFNVESFPVLGCFGAGYGPKFAALTQEYLAPANIGCGDAKVVENLNALTCMSLSDSVEAENYNYLKSVTADISNCAEKSNPNFVKAVERALNKNFKSKENPGFSFKLIK